MRRHEVIYNEHINAIIFRSKHCTHHEAYEKTLFSIRIQKIDEIRNLSNEKSKSLVDSISKSFSTLKIILKRSLKKKLKIERNTKKEKSDHSNNAFSEKIVSTILKKKIDIKSTKIEKSMNIVIIEAIFYKLLSRQENV